MFWTLLSRIAVRYSYYLVWPVAATIGVLGYNIENLISDKYTPTLESVKEKREERQLKEEKEVDSLKKHSFVPKTIFEKNLSPSLLEDDPRVKSPLKEKLNP